MDGHNNTSNSAQTPDSVPDLPRRAPLRLNPDDFAEEMKAFDLDEDQAREFLQTLWDILVMCADIELGFDPVSLICGQNAEIGDCRPNPSPELVEFKVKASPENNNEKEET